jgi:hypothetical protein
MKRTLAIISGAMIATALFVGACGDDDPSEEDATAAFCSDLDALGVALDAYADLTVNSTIDEVEDAQQDVSDAYDAVLESAGDVAEARVDDLETAYEDLAASVDDVSGEDTVGDAITDIAAKAVAVGAARADLATSANCS